MMTAAMRSGKLTAEDRRTPISRQFLIMAVFVYGNRFCLGPLFLSTSIRWFFCLWFVCGRSSVDVDSAVFVYGRSVWCPMLQEALAEIGEALAEEGWGAERKLRQICMTVSEFVFDNWATESELSVLAAVEVPGKQTHTV